MDGSRLTVVLTISGAMIVCGCDAASDHDDVSDYARAELIAAPQAAALDLAEVKFETGFEFLPATRATFIDRISLLSPMSWPQAISPALKSSLQRSLPPSPELVFDDFNNVTVNAQWVEVSGKRFFFLSAAPPNGNHTLVVIADGSDAPQTVVLSNIQIDSYHHRLEFDVACLNGAVVLVYSDAAGIHQVIGKLNNGELVFDPPRCIDQQGDGRNNLQLRVASGALHLIWTTRAGLGSSSTLWYMRTASPQAAWEKPVIISPTALRSTLAVEGENVYIGWLDHRFRTGLMAPKNASKMFIQRSADGGKSFFDPVLFNDKDDQSQTPEQVLLYPRKDDLLVLWRDELGPLRHGDWRFGAISKDLSTLQIGGTMSNQALRTAYANRMRPLIEPKRAARANAFIDLD